MQCPVVGEGLILPHRRMQEGLEPRWQAVRDRKIVQGQGELHRTGLAGYLELVAIEAGVILGVDGWPLTRGAPFGGGL